MGRPLEGAIGGPRDLVPPPPGAACDLALHAARLTAGAERSETMDDRAACLLSGLCHRPESAETACRSARQRLSSRRPRAPGDRSGAEDLERRPRAWGRGLREAEIARACEPGGSSKPRATLCAGHGRQKARSGPLHRRPRFGNMRMRPHLGHIRRSPRFGDMRKRPRLGPTRRRPRLGAHARETALGAHARVTAFRTSAREAVLRTGARRSVLGTFARESALGAAVSRPAGSSSIAGRPERPRRGTRGQAYRWGRWPVPDLRGGASWCLASGAGETGPRCEAASSPMRRLPGTRAGGLRVRPRRCCGPLPSPRRRSGASAA